MFQSTFVGYRQKVYRVVQNKPICVDEMDQTYSGFPFC